MVLSRVRVPTVYIVALTQECSTGLPGQGLRASDGTSSRASTSFMPVGVLYSGVASCARWCDPFYIFVQRTLSVWLCGLSVDTFMSCSSADAK